MVTTKQQLDELRGIVSSLAASVVAHDNQIDGLIRLADKHSRDIARVDRQLANVIREWQAYLKRLPAQ